MPEITDKYYSLLEEWQSLRNSGELAVFNSLNFPPNSLDQHLSTDNHTGLLAAESGITQVYAGENLLILDKDSGHGQLSVDNTLSLKAQEIRLAANKVIINSRLLNPSLLNKQELLTKPTSLFDSNPDLVVGNADPEKGQFNIRLNDLLQKTSLVTDSLEFDNSNKLLDEALERMTKLVPD